MSGALKIVIIDGSGGLCRELHGWLAATGHQVALFTGWRPQLGDLGGTAPDLAILGVAAATGGGLTICQRFSAYCHRHRFPLIVVSDDPDHEYELPDLFDFQSFPVDRARLLSCVNRLEESRRGSPARLGFGLDDLTPFRDFLEAHSGLHFGAHNQRLLERGVMRRMQALCLADPLDYLAYLSATLERQDELNRLLGLLTIGETCFFRYRTHREAVIRFVFPELLERCAARRRLRIWSAGCSTGEEPYSLAMVLQAHFPQLHDWDVQILATDINKRALNLAREGVYGRRALRQTDDAFRERFFRQAGEHFVLDRQVRSMVRFVYLNLQTATYPDTGNGTAGLDLIFCRNVLIYFRPETTRQIVRRFSESLHPEAFLFLGHAETLQGISDRFHRLHQHGAFFYQRKPEEARRCEPAGEAMGAPSPPLSATVPKTAAAAKPPPPWSGAAAVTPTPPSVERLYAEAMAAFDREEFAAADRLFDQVLAITPGDAPALVGKGLISANQGNYDAARQWCARAIKYDDLCAPAYLLRGLILDMEGRYERALVEYQKVLWLDRDFVMAHYFSAKAHGRLGQTAQQLRGLRNATRTLEKHPDTGSVPFSGGLSRPVLLEICRKELAAIQLSSSPAPQG